MRKFSRQAALVLIGALAPSVLVAQVGTMTAAAVAPAAAPALNVGDMAPDFTLPAATAKGPQAPVKLSALRGKTVVLAFYPRQRSGGCTVQMLHYRDEYANLFDNGKSATLFAISNDSVPQLASWAADSSFPFTFLSDVNNDAAKLYGTASANTTRSARTGLLTGDSRVLFVVGPDGKIAKIMRPFLEGDPTAYLTMKDAIETANRKKM